MRKGKWFNNELKMTTIMKKQLYHTPVIECVQVESPGIMTAGSPVTIMNGGNASEFGGGTPIAD